MLPSLVSRYCAGPAGAAPGDALAPDAGVVLRHAVVLAVALHVRGGTGAAVTGHGQCRVGELQFVSVEDVMLDMVTNLATIGALLASPTGGD